MYLNTLCQGVDIPPFDASLPHLKHFTAIVRRRPRTSTKNVAYIVQTFTADAALEILNLQCDFKGWDTSTIYRAIKRHSKTLQILCAPGWYAHTSMLQALDEFTMLEEVTIGRIVHLEVRQLQLLNMLSPMSLGERPEGLQEDRKGLPLQPPTYSTSRHKRGQDATPSKPVEHSHVCREPVYRQGRPNHRCMEGEDIPPLFPALRFINCLFRLTGHTIQTLNDHGGTSFGVRRWPLSVRCFSDLTKDHSLLSRFTS